MTYKVEGIILRSQEIKEVDRFYWLFSREKGKQRVIGIGTRRPKAKLAGGLEPITQSEIFLIEGRRIDRIRGVLVLDQFSGIKGDLEKLILVRKVFDSLEKLLPQEESNEEFYQALVFFLQKVAVGQWSEEKEKLELFSLFLFWQLLFWRGVAPSLQRCVGCQKTFSETDQFFFSIPEGLWCEKCQREKRSVNFALSKEELKVIRFLVKGRKELVIKLKVETAIISKIKKITNDLLLACS